MTTSRHLAAAGAFAAAVLASGALVAGPDRVALPEGYQTKFVLYNQIERPDRNPPAVRLFYASPDAFKAMKAGIPSPDGTVLVMETRKAVLGPDGKPAIGVDGRWQASPEIVSIEVQEKRAGWGADHPPEKRNADWDYAAFTPDGKLRTEVKTDACFTCHLNRKQRDFTFTFVKFFEDRDR